METLRTKAIPSTTSAHTQRPNDSPDNAVSQGRAWKTLLSMQSPRAVPERLSWQCNLPGPCLKDSPDNAISQGRAWKTLLTMQSPRAVPERLSCQCSLPGPCLKDSPDNAISQGRAWKTLLTMQSPRAVPERLSWQCSLPGPCLKDSPDNAVPQDHAWKTLLTMQSPRTVPIPRHWKTLLTMQSPRTVPERLSWQCSLPGPCPYLDTERLSWQRSLPRPCLKDSPDNAVSQDRAHPQLPTRADSLQVINTPSTRLCNWWPLFPYFYPLPATPLAMTSLLTVWTLQQFWQCWAELQQKLALNGNLIMEIKFAEALSGLIFFCVPQLYLWGSPLQVRFLHMRLFL